MYHGMFVKGFNSIYSVPAYLYMASKALLLRNVFMSSFKKKPGHRNVLVS